MPAHLLLAHRHGVDGAVESVDGDRRGRAEFFATVFSEQDDSELRGCDVEAAADSELLLVGDVWRLQGAESRREVGWAGLLDEWDDDQIAGSEVGLVMIERIELLAVATVERRRCEDQQDAVAIDEGGESLLGLKHRGKHHRGEEREGEEEFFHFRLLLFFVAAFFWMRRL